MTTEERIKKAIVDTINRHQGLKSTELLAFVPLQPEIPVVEDMMKWLEELIACGDLVEVCYEHPTITYREKSFILPKGSRFGNRESVGIL